MEMSDDKEGINLAYEQINYYRNMPNHIKAISIKLSNGFENGKAVDLFPILNGAGKIDMPTINF